MPGFLRQSTASQSVILGPFIDDTDFKTAETALTIANTDIKLMAAGGTSANKNSGGGTHRVNGMYSVTFDATDTATVGMLDVSVVVSGALPVFDRFQVLEEAVYDALIAAAAPGYVANAPVNVAQFGGANGTFSGGRPEVNASHWGGTAVASANVNANVTQISGDAVAADNCESFFDGTGYAGTGNVIPTVTTLTNAPSDSSGVTTLLSRVTALRAGYWDNLSAGAVALEATAQAILTDTAEIGVAGAGLTNINLPDQTMNITGNLSGSVGSIAGITFPTNFSFLSIDANGRVDLSKVLGSAVNPLISGRLDSNVQAMATGVLDAAALASDAANEVADALLDRANAIETGLTPRLAWRYSAASLAGVLSGAATTTVTVAGVGVGTTRISATVDADGNRSAVVLS